VSSSIALYRPFSPPPFLTRISPTFFMLIHFFFLRIRSPYCSRWRHLFSPSRFGGDPSQDVFSPPFELRKPFSSREDISPFLRNLPPVIFPSHARAPGSDTTAVFSSDIYILLLLAPMSRGLYGPGGVGAPFFFFFFSVPDLFPWSSLTIFPTSPFPPDARRSDPFPPSPVGDDSPGR